MPGIAKADVDGAKRMAAVVAARVRATGDLSPVEETVGEWFDRWLRHRRYELRIASTGNDESRFRVWLAPLLERIPIRSVTAADVECVVVRLESATENGELTRKTAKEVFQVLAKMLSDASRSEHDALRVRSDDPSTSVRRPFSCTRPQRDRESDRAYIKYLHERIGRLEEVLAQGGIDPREVL